MKVLAKIVKTFDITVTLFPKDCNKIKIYDMINHQTKFVNITKFLKQYNGKCLTNIKMSDLIVINQDTIKELLTLALPRTYFLIDKNIYTSFIEANELQNKKYIEVLTF